MAVEAAVTGRSERSSSDAQIAANRHERVAALDKSDCPNGSDGDGNYPCDPKVLYGGGMAECQTCGRVAAWKETDDA